MKDPYRFIALPVDVGGCGWYRVRQPMHLINKHTPHDTHIIDTQGDDMTEVAKAFSVSDVAVIRQGGEAAIPMLRKDFPNLKLVLDIDDNIEEISPYSEHYGEYGTRDFTDQASGKEIWKDGVSFNIRKNQARVDSLLQGLRDADMVTVTTEPLADYARQFNKKVAVLPNLIDTTAWWRLSLKPAPRVRIGWAGGVSHYEDLYSVKDALNTVLRRTNAELVMVGAHFPGIIDQDLRHKVEVHPWTAFQAHSYRLMCLNLDIAIVPLTNLPFNHYKSPIKYLEFAAMGIPSVVANVTPYKEEVLNGETAYLYDNQGEAAAYLFHLVDEVKEREMLGKKAESWIRTNRDAAKHINLWVEAYASLLS